MSKSKNGDMNNIYEHAHTHTHIQENQKLKKVNGCSPSPFRFWTLLRPYSITIDLDIIFRTALTKRINTQELVLLFLTLKISLSAGYRR